MKVNTPKQKLNSGSFASALGALHFSKNEPLSTWHYTNFADAYLHRLTNFL